MIEAQKEKKQLPLFEDKTQLPTGKNHISFSELFDFRECSFRHKLKYVKNINLDKSTIHTIFGRVIHKALEEYVQDKKILDLEKYKKDFEEQVSLLMLSDCPPTLSDINDFSVSLVEILKQVPSWLDLEFPGWVLLSSEEQLFESINGQTNKYFKGFVDLVIKVPKRRKKRNLLNLESLKGEIVPGEWVYYIIDWKSTNWGWRKEEKRSFEKHLQLILYKHFWCKKTSIDSKLVRCAFVFLKRKPSKNGQRVSLMSVSVGPKTTKKALYTLNNAINQIQMGMVLKNRSSCRWCKYANTIHCP